MHLWLCRRVLRVAAGQVLSGLRARLPGGRKWNACSLRSLPMGKNTSILVDAFCVLVISHCCIHDHNLVSFFFLFCLYVAVLSLYFAPQNAADPAEKVGCSTPERPSSTWIKGHLSDYSEPGSTTPLQPQMVGGGACNEDLDCGGRKDHRGTCQASANPRSSGVTTTNIGFANGISSGSASSSGGSSDGTSSDSSDSSASSGKVCVCEAGWIGPWCRASYGEDPIDWEPTETVGVSLGSPCCFSYSFFCTKCCFLLRLMLRHEVAKCACTCCI